MKVDITNLVRKNVLGIKPYKPGKPIPELAEELGLKQIIKLASNESPLGPSIEARKAIRRGLKGFSIYPEGSGKRLREVLAQYWHVGPDWVILGNGSNEIIELLYHAFINPGENIVTCSPSFLVYKLTAEVFGIELREVPLKDFRYDLEGIIDAIDSSTKMVIICNPNNPTGTIVDNNAVKEFMKRIGEDIIVVFDEAYSEFADSKRFPNAISYIKRGRPVVVLRTFSKIFGLAGLRIGYGISIPQIVEMLNKVRQPFNVNAAAQLAAESAIKDEMYKHRIINLVKEGKEYLYREFHKLQLYFIPSEANFVLVKVEDGKRIFEQLLRKGIIIRPMHEYNLPEYIRVTVGTMYQNRKFIRALKEVLGRSVLSK